MSSVHRGSRFRLLIVAIGVLIASAVSGRLQAQADQITRISLPIGRSYPITTAGPITKVSINNPEIADVVVISEREVVINARGQGETDAIVWEQAGTRVHYRIQVQSAEDRQQIALYVKFAEVRRDALREITVSGLYRDNNVRVGTGATRSDNAFDETGKFLFGALDNSFLTVLTDFGTDDLLAFLQAQQQRGNARILAEPNIMAGNRDSASFLAGGELPIPVAQGGSTGDDGARITIQYKEFGVRLRFIGEILSDSLIKLTVSPEVSSLDFGNAITISGFRIPAFRTRRVTSTIDVRRDQSLIISGMFNTEREQVKTGLPLLMDIPLLGQLFSSTRFQNNETELLVVVTPVIINPLRPPRENTIRFQPDTALPAKGAIEKRIGNPPRRP